MTENRDGDDDDTAGCSQDVPVWTFAKGGDELTIEQWNDGDVVVVVLTRADEMGNETVSSYEFSDQSGAEQFHANLEPTLLEFGWSFVGYLPERRSHERRQRLRMNDRRRWWTDGAIILD